MRWASCWLAAGCVVWAFLIGGTAAAADAIQAFNIPAEDLGSALRDFGRQANQQILFSTDSVLGKRSPQIQGDFTVEAALARLLAGTDLVVTRIADGSLLISRHDSGAAPDLPEGSAAGMERRRLQRRVLLQTFRHIQHGV